MHVLWTPSWFPTTDQPLNGSFFAEQVKMLRQDGLTVGVIALNPRTAWHHRPGSFSIDREDQVIYQDLPMVPKGIVPGDGKIIEVYAKRLAKIYEREFGIPDVIHAHSVFPGILLAKALANYWNVPYGLTEHRPSSLTRNPESFRYAMIRDAVVGANFRYAVSPDFAARLSEYYDSPEFGVMSLPVPAAFFEQPLHHTSDDVFTFVHVSHLDRNKRVEETIAAFNVVHKKFPHTRLLIVGGRPERVAELRAFTSILDCQDAVEFAGRVSRDEMPAQMNRGDCLLLFSAREAGGTVFAEAQSMGIPCIATATPGGRHMASDGVGMVVPIDDRPSFILAMETMVEDAREGNILPAAEIRQRAWERSSSSVFIERHEKAYDDAMNHRGRQADVLFVSRIHLPEAAAASLRIDAVERAVRAAGARVRVLTSRPPKNSPAPAHEVDVERVPVLRDKEDYVRGYVPYMSFDIQAMLRSLVRAKPDIAVIEPPPTTGTVMRLVSMIKRFPYIWYAADVWSDASESTGAPDIVVKAVRAMERFTISGAAGVVAVSEGVADRVRELGGKNIQVSPNGADTSIFRPDGPVVPDEERAELGVVHPYFIYAGTASEWQGAELFVEAFDDVLRSHPEVQMVFLARGSSLARINELAAELVDRRGEKPVVVVDPVTPEKAAQWQRGAIGALVSIVPGLGYDFAYPTKVLTALACGTPVVYAGPGPARGDITVHDLGVVADYTRESVANALQDCLALSEDSEGRLHRAAWVEDNRSMAAMGQDVARFVLDFAQPER